MAERRIPAKQIQRNDTHLNWETKNPTLDKGEIGVETDTGRFKIGDGVNPWNGLAYSGEFASSIYEMNTGASFQLWVGTQDEFTALPDTEKDDKTIFIIK